MATAVVPLLKVDDLAQMLSISRRGLFAMRARGHLPRGVKIGGRALRWDANEVRAWLDAGAPPAAEWEQTRKSLVHT